jgi:hypothetical protein
LFTTAPQKDAILAFIAQRPEAVAMGCAMEMARTTRSDIWPSTDALIQDCAILLAAEVNKYAHQRGVQIKTSANDIIRCQAFKEAFTLARSYYDRLRRNPGSDVQYEDGADPDPQRRVELTDRLHHTLIQELQRNLPPEL